MEELKSDLARLQSLKQELDYYKGVKDEYDQLKEQVRFSLQSQMIPNMGYDHIKVSLAERPTALITDELEVEKWLLDNDFNLEEYKRLDSTRISPIVLNRFKEDGEIIPGTQVVSTPYLSVRGLK